MERNSTARTEADKDTDDKDSVETQNTKKTKKAERIGASALFDTDRKSKNQEGEKESKLDRARKAGPENDKTTTESLKNEAPEIEPDEVQHVVPELAKIAKLQLPEAAAELEPGAAEETEKVREFYDLVEAGQDAEDALSEKLAEINDTDEGETESEPGYREFKDEGEILLTESSEKTSAEDDNAPSSRSSSTATTAASLKSSDAASQTPAAGGTSRGNGAGPPLSPPGAGWMPSSGGSNFGFNSLPPNSSATQPTGFNRYKAPLGGEQYLDDGNPAAAALLGGIIGYLVGRRRGRIRTEKKLLPIQKKLKNEVVDLQWQLQAKEMKIRKAVREKNYALGHHEAEPEQASNENKNVLKPQRNLGPEASQIHGKKVTQEHIGHTVVTAETRVAETIELKAPNLEAKKVEAEPPKIQKNIETLNRIELLKLSEKIIVDGTSLREIYETHLVSEKGLRRLVTEHLKGGNIKKALRREIIEREIDFERDPAMRDVAVPATTGSSASPALKAMLEKATASLPSGEEELAYRKARQDYEEKMQAGERKQQRILDGALLSTIIILAAVIVILLLSHR
jgi:hypothetical protein